MEGFEVGRSVVRLAVPAICRGLVRAALAFAPRTLVLFSLASRPLAVRRLARPALALRAFTRHGLVPLALASLSSSPLVLAPLLFAVAPRAEAGERPPSSEAARGGSEAAEGRDEAAGEGSGALAALEQFVAGLDPLLKGAAAPVLATLIEDSREQAVAQGVDAIPAAIRAEIEDYVPAEVLDRVRWCVACGGPFSLQHNTFLLGYAPAITLDYVVVFQRREDALGDPSLWVHELKHVMQYTDWGVAGFAARYVDDYEAVESEAAEYRWQWMKKTRYLERRRAKTGRS
jgi:hypothetical protein